MPEQWNELPDFLVGNETAEQRSLCLVATLEYLWRKQNCLIVSVAAIAWVADPMSSAVGVHLWLKFRELACSNFVLDV